jgi:two-component system, OmpR family, sensor kinase
VSLRRRVIIGFIAVAAVLVVSNIALTSTFRSFLIGRVDQQLETAGGPLGNRPGAVGGRGGRNAPVSEYFQAVGDLQSGTVTPVGGIYDPLERPGPKLEITTVAAKATEPGAPPEPFTTGSITGDGEWRVVVVASRVEPSRIAVLGISLDGVDATLRQSRNIQIAGTLAVLAALGLVSFWVMRLGVHPIAAMADTAEKITEGDLSKRVEHPDETTEAGRLGAAFNAMLSRIQEAFRAREDSEARVRQFAADASHELRTPLTSIRGYAELWRAGGLKKPDELADAMGRIEGEATRMGLLVDELLNLARLDQEESPLNFTDVDLGGLATDAVGDARVVEPDRPVAIAIDGDAPVVVRGNEPALRQVLANLLANVRAHTPPKTPALVTVTRNGEHAVLAVADEGPGMHDDVAAHVFERFYRADKARARAAGGTGLGLAIVESIARAHGGSVSVASAPGEGARFEIKLPLPQARAH